MIRTAATNHLTDEIMLTDTFPTDLHFLTGLHHIQHTANQLVANEPSHPYGEHPIRLVALHLMCSSSPVNR